MSINNLSKICIFDNTKGIELPKKIDVFPIEVVLGSTINEIHEAAGKCQLFCAIINIPTEQFIVPTEENREVLQSILKFGKREETVTVRENSMWYNTNAEQNLIISDTVNISSDDLAVLLNMYIKEIDTYNRTKLFTPVEMYRVINTRNSEEMFRTPNFEEAAAISDRSPCTVVKTKNGDIVYSSKFGKVRIPQKSIRSAARINKSRHTENDGSFKITFEI